MIRKLSHKWEKRTRNIANNWPSGGSFDLEICRDLQVLIQDHKLQNRLDKRKQELDILDLFRKKGETLRAAAEEHKNTLCQKEEATALLQPPYVQQLPRYRRDIQENYTTGTDERPIHEFKDDRIIYLDLNTYTRIGGEQKGDIRRHIPPAGSERMARGKEDEADEEKTMYEAHTDGDYGIDQDESVARLEKSIVAAEDELKETTVKFAAAHFCSKRGTQHGVLQKRSKA